MTSANCEGEHLGTTTETSIRSPRSRNNRDAYRSRDLSCLVRTKLSTQSNSGLSLECSSVSSPGRAIGLVSGVSKARTGDIVLKGVWFRKKMVQSSSCVSAPSGNMDMASTLRRQEFMCFHRQMTNGHTFHQPLEVVETGTLVAHPPKYETLRAIQTNNGWRFRPLKQSLSTQ
jgi:hypothetical protein